MLRTLFKTDLEQALAIENSVHVVPWTADTFKMCFESGYFGWVIELDKEIMGFIIVSLRAEECHILNLCVARDYQHQGWGRQLLDYALKHARHQGIGIAYLEVRRSNTRAISLYKKMKFHLIGVRKDYYPAVSGNEDALIFAKSLRENAGAL
jgi:[ribosomal protein S18]-alanine N-acetyltransferase